MSVFHNNALIGAGGGVAASVDANITKSLRFNSGDSANLSRTPSTAGNRVTWTWSAWVKRTKSSVGSTYQTIFSAGADGNNNSAVVFDNSDRLEIWNVVGNANVTQKITSQVFRDFSSWYHFVISATSSTLKLYVNGVEVTDWATDNEPGGENWSFSGANAHYLGHYWDGGSNFKGDFYLADIYFIDGSALDATSFGASDDNGVWQASGYSGTYGTNGFHLLDFANEATIGHDSSGNENDFTANNLVEPQATFHLSKASLYPWGGATYASGHDQLIYAFDGDNSTYLLLSNQNNHGIDFSPGITVTQKVEIYGLTSNQYARTNIDNIATQYTAGQWTTIYTGTGTLTSITMVSNSNRPALAGIKVDGVELIAVESDVSFDAPQNDTTNTDSGAGGEVSGCYCTLNPLHDRYNIGSSGTKTFSEGNLKIVATTGDSTRSRYLFGTIGVSSGKWYYEMTADNTAGGISVGFAPRQFADEINSIEARYLNNGSIRVNGTTYSSLATFANGDVVSVALDLDNGTVQFYKNGSTVGNAYSVSSGYTYLPLIIIPATGTSSTGATFNFGQRAWAYSAPSNHKALCSTNLPTATVPDGSAHFDTALYTGNNDNGTQAITGLGLSSAPDWVWIKSRSSSSYGHMLFDSVRGPAKALYSDNYGPEGNPNAYGKLNSFDSSGFTVAPGSSDSTNVNANNATYVAWCWNMGANSNKTYTVKVVSDSGNKYRFDDHGTSAVTLDLAEGSTYIFDQSDSSNSGHPLRFSTTSNGTHGGGSEYTTGVTATGTPGSAGAKTTIVVAASAPTLYYYCTNHSGMGGQINTNSTAGSTRLSGSENSAVYNQSSNWTSLLTSSAGTINNPGNSFDGSTATTSQLPSTSPGSYIQFGATLTNVTKLEIYQRSNSDISGTGIQTYNNAPSVQWVELTLTSSTVSNIRFEKNTNDPGIYAIRVNGKILVDSTATPTNVPETTSIVKVNQETGMSIVSWVGTGSLTTVAHGLNSVPHFMAVKNRNSSGNTNWCVYHVGLTSAAYTLGFDSSYFEDPNDPTWGSTAPTSSVFTVKTRASANESGKNMIGYIFTPVSGFSSFQKYTGNGSSDGPFVYTGHRVAFLLIKRINTSGAWVIVDNKRDGYNETYKWLEPNTTTGEQTVTPVANVDFLSNGFKLRGNGATTNASGSTYVYAAFAENPLQANGGLAR